MDYSNPVLTTIRIGLGKCLGVLRPMVRLIRNVRRYDYEDKFCSALMSSLRETDTIWDVGANVGYYTAKFSAAAMSGTVIAFEPSPRTFAKLQKNCGRCSNVRLESVALGDAEGLASFYVSDQDAEDSLLKRRNGREVAVEEVKVHVARAIS